MAMSIAASSTSVGLPVLKWQTYSVTVGTSATSLAPPGIALTGYTGNSDGTVTLACANILWARVGQFVNITGTTANGGFMNQSQFLITAVTTTPSATITVKIQQSPTNYGQINFAGVSAIAEGTVALVTYAQTAYFSDPASGNVVTIYADSVSATAGYGWSAVLTPTGTVPAAASLTAPVNFKFNLADLFAIATGSAQTLNILYM
jgi:hypothetical protein